MKLLNSPVGFVFSLALCNCTLAQQTIMFTNKVATFTNLQGRAYHDVQLVRADMDGIIYREAEGVGGGRVCYTNLAAALLESWGLDTNRIAVAKLRAERKAVSDAAHQQTLQEQAQRDAASRVLERQLADLDTTFRGEVFQVTRDGALIKPVGPIGSDDLVLVSECPKQLVDGEAVTVTAYNIGLYTYTDVQGGTRTVRHYTCSTAKAVAYVNNRPKQAKARPALSAVQNASREVVRRVEQEAVTIAGRALQRVGDKVLVDSSYMSGVNEHIAEFQAETYLKPRLKVQKLPTSFNGFCLLTDYPGIESVADNDFIVAIAYPTGTYQYTAVSGAGKTVRRFTADINVAVAGEHESGYRK